MYWDKKLRSLGVCVIRVNDAAKLYVCMCACAVVLVSIITIFVLLKASGVIRFGNSGS